MFSLNLNLKWHQGIFPPCLGNGLLTLDLKNATVFPPAPLPLSYWYVRRVGNLILDEEDGFADPHQLVLLTTSRDAFSIEIASDSKATSSFGDSWILTKTFDPSVYCSRKDLGDLKWEMSFKAPYSQRLVLPERAQTDFKKWLGHQGIGGHGSFVNLQYSQNELPSCFHENRRSRNTLLCASYDFILSYEGSGRSNYDHDFVISFMKRSVFLLFRNSRIKSVSDSNRKLFQEVARLGPNSVSGQPDVAGNGYGVTTRVRSKGILSREPPLLTAISDHLKLLSSLGVRVGCSFELSAELVGGTHYPPLTHSRLPKR